MGNTCVKGSLRHYQSEALNKARAAVQAGAGGVLIQMPTGTGKTRTAVEACVSHRSFGGRSLWVAPRKELLGQASDALRARGLEPEIDCWVRSIQELSVPGAVIPKATMIVLDEARHYLSDRWSLLRAALPKAIVLGLDATPERQDARGLGFMFDVLITAITVKEAIAGGYLVPAEMIRPDRTLESGEIAQHPVTAYSDCALGSKAILFAPRIQQAIQYACAFRDRGITSGVVFGDMPAKERVDILARFAAGEIEVLCNQNLLVEGFDLPAVDSIILARRFGSAGGYLQAVGRGLRPSEGKDRCIVFDLCGVSHLYGDPDADRTYHLEGKAIRLPGDELDVRFCPLCGQPNATSVCDECGYDGAMRMRPPRVLGLPMTRFAALRREDDEARAVRLSRWMQHARNKGWREGQAFHRYKGAFGEMPSRAVITRARSLS